MDLCANNSARRTVWIASVSKLLAGVVAVIQDGMMVSAGSRVLAAWLVPVPRIMVRVHAAVSLVTVVTPVQTRAKKPPQQGPVYRRHVRLIQGGLIQGGLIQGGLIQGGLIRGMVSIMLIHVWSGRYVIG